MAAQLPSDTEKLSRSSVDVRRSSKIFKTVDRACVMPEVPYDALLTRSWKSPGLLASSPWPMDSLASITVRGAPVWPAATPRPTPSGGAIAGGRVLGLRTLTPLLTPKCGLESGLLTPNPNLDYLRVFFRVCGTRGEGRGIGLE